MLVSYVIPALNEEESIAAVLDEVSAAGALLAERGLTHEVIVVDGMSGDRTAERAASRGARVTVADRGYGRQYRHGILAAAGDVIVTGDSDGTYPFSDSPRLIRLLLDRDLDFITTNRFNGLAQGSMTPMHFVGNRLLTAAVNALFGLSLKDSQSGMWVFRRSILPNLTLKDGEMAFSQEIKIDAYSSCRCAEVDITYRPRIGKTKLRTFVHGYLNFAHVFGKRVTK